MEGQIIKVNAGFYYILSNKQEYITRGSGNLRKQNILPVVGDFVTFEPNGFITKIHKRNNYLARPKVANVDQVIIITSLKEPDYSSILLNKLLAIIEFSEIKPIIIFTKKDLTKNTYIQKYIEQGYKSFEINNNDKESLQQISTIFKNKLNVFTGQTGSGKTTLINNLANISKKTQAISKSLGRGKHTTRVVEIIEWFGGRLIDTPGFSFLEFNLTKLQLAKSYHDFKNLSIECKFRTCIHSEEPNCKIKNAVKHKIISKDRYKDYLILLKETKNG